MARKLIVIFAVLVVSVIQLGAAEILFDRFDKNHSTIGFTDTIMDGVSEVAGMFTEFSVTLHYSESDLTRSKVSIAFVHNPITSQMVCST